MTDRKQKPAPKLLKIDWMSETTWPCPSATVR